MKNIGSAAKEAFDWAFENNITFNLEKHKDEIILVIRDGEMYCATLIIDNHGKMEASSYDFTYEFLCPSIEALRQSRTRKQEGG